MNLKQVTVMPPRIAQGPSESNGKVPLGPVPRFCAYCSNVIMNDKPVTVAEYENGKKRAFCDMDHFFTDWRAIQRWGWGWTNGDETKN